MGLLKRRVIEASWRDAGGRPLVEQFGISTLGGSDVVAMVLLGGAIVTHFRVDNPLLTHTLFPIYVAALILAPPAAFRDAVECLWVRVVPPAGGPPVQVLPDGGADLIWQAGRGAFVAGHGSK